MEEQKLKAQLLNLRDDIKCINLFVNRTAKDIENTILHELCHAAAPFRGHGIMMDRSNTEKLEADVSTERTLQCLEGMMLS